MRRGVFSRIRCKPKDGVHEGLNGFGRRNTGLTHGAGDCVNKGEMERRYYGAHKGRTAGRVFPDTATSVRGVVDAVSLASEEGGDAGQMLDCTGFQNECSQPLEGSLRHGLRMRNDLVTNGANPAGCFH